MQMRSCMQTLLRGLFIVCFGSIFALVQRASVRWDHLVYTQLWPEAICIQINESQSGHRCSIPSIVDSWTIHGLWPDAKTGADPAYCNDSWPFRLDQIKDLQPDLEKHWPNYIVSESVDSLWKHEWTKHGTCSASEEDFNSEHKYFLMGLKLQQKFNLDRFLSEAAIRPAINVTYTLQEIRDALQSRTKTFWRIMCMEARSKKEQILGQIEICIDKQFSPMDCDPSKFVTPKFENSKFKRLRRSMGDPEWDPYPYFPQFQDCIDHLPIRYLPIT